MSGSIITVTDWNGLANSKPTDPGVTIDAGATRTFTLVAKIYTWNGTPRVDFKADIATFYQQAADLTIPFVDPTTMKGTSSVSSTATATGTRNSTKAKGFPTLK